MCLKNFSNCFSQFVLSSIVYIIVLSRKGLSRKWLAYNCFGYDCSVYTWLYIIVLYIIFLSRIVLSKMNLCRDVLSRIFFLRELFCLKCPINSKTLVSCVEMWKKDKCMFFCLAVKKIGTYNNSASQYFALDKIRFFETFQ